MGVGHECTDGEGHKCHGKEAEQQNKGDVFLESAKSYGAPLQDVLRKGEETRMAHRKQNVIIIQVMR
jgi:hypothetical protein